MTTSTHRYLQSLFCVFLVGAGCSNSRFETRWHADFEDQSLEQWSYLLHPQGIEVSDEHAFAGQYAAKVTLEGTEDFIWYNNPALNRSEMQYKPNSIKEGDQTHIRFSFMLPRLFSDARHEFAYWESDGSYQQLMRFNIAANRLSFSPALGLQKNDVLWTMNTLDAGVWYTVDMRIKWSSDENFGSISIDLNGENVVANHTMQTLLKNEGAFIQLGILRDQTDAIETIWIDEVLEFKAD